MIVLEAYGIEHAIEGRLLFKAERLIIGSRDRIGVVGMNGAGKTTLLNILAGQLEPDCGTVARAVPCTLVPQFKPNPHHLSGGEVTALYLDRALASQPSLLFADEPTMHLDAAHTQQLEERLAAYDGAIIVVSHDRAFLDRLCTHIWAIENGTVSVYKGNYGAYAEMRELQKRQHEERYEEYIRKKRQLEEAIAQKTRKAAGMLKPPKRMSSSESRLYKDKAASTQKSVHQSIKAIETRLQKLERVEKPREPAHIKLDLPGNRDIVSKSALRVEKLSAAFGRRTLWRDVSFTIPRGSKTALIGPNGSGKSTLLRRIVTGGEGVYPAPGVKIGWFSQNLDILHPDRSVLANVSETSVQTDAHVRLILSRLLFRGQDVFKPVKALSGGERVKAALAKIVLSDVNLLVLDEPTNFLDIPSMEALEQVLAEYKGTVLFVSHDRRFVDNVADRLLEIRDGRILGFEGKLEEYRKHQAESAAKGKAELEEELMVVELKLSEWLGSLAAAGPGEPVGEEADRQFRELVTRRNELRRQLGKP